MRVPCAGCTLKEIRTELGKSVSANCFMSDEFVSIYNAAIRRSIAHYQINLLAPSRLELQRLSNSDGKIAGDVLLYYLELDGACAIPILPSA